MSIDLPTNRTSSEPHEPPRGAGPADVDSRVRTSARRRSPRRLALRRFTRNRVSVASAVVLVALLLIAFVLPLVISFDPTSVNLSQAREAPSSEHLLGLDTSGRDVLSRMIYGGRTSMGIGLAAGFLAVTIGSVLGAVSGAFGGWVDTLLMRAADVFLSFPQVVVVVVIVGIFGPSVPLLIFALGALNWPGAARLVRGVVLTMRERDFVLASRAFGARQWWLIKTHLLPSATSQIVVVFTLTTAVSVLQEAGLSFLGLGVQAPTPSWGNMLFDAQNITVISTMPWLWVPPGLAIALTVLCVNFVGDGLRDATDPRQR